MPFGSLPRHAAAPAALLLALAAQPQGAAAQACLLDNGAGGSTGSAIASGADATACGASAMATTQQSPP